MSPAIHQRPPFRAEHIGSLLRPQALFEKRALFEQNKCTREELDAVTDDAIKYVVQLQRDVGISTITDGELRRSMFFEGVFDNLEGITAISNRPITTFKEYIPHIRLMYQYGLKEAETVFCTVRTCSNSSSETTRFNLPSFQGKIRRTKPFYLDQFNYLKGLVPAEDVKHIKITMCSPSWFHQRHGSDLTYDLSVYKNDDEYFDDLGIAYRAEIKELYDRGCRHIQFDDPTFCYFCNDRMIADMEKAGVDHEALLDTYIRAINVCTQDRPADLTVGVHMCRGNYKGGVHFSEGGYARIAAKLFNTLDVDTFYLEYDTDRAGDFAPLKYLPSNKVAVLGLVTTKNPKLETVEELKSRVNEAVDVMTKDDPPRTREDALNQFALHQHSDERKKLAVLVEAAKQIW
ncbi:hypothetical protein C0991_000239 [Blastosporella zonata]|nr:hypothetical protein C0991_000239 [Blastosporella zonata]